MNSKLLRYLSIALISTHIIANSSDLEVKENNSSWTNKVKSFCKKHPYILLAIGSASLIAISFLLNMKNNTAFDTLNENINKAITNRDFKSFAYWYKKSGLKCSEEALKEKFDQLCLKLQIVK